VFVYRRSDWTGVIALIVGDFALVWQPVPDWVPARHAVAYGTGALMILLGAGFRFAQAGLGGANSAGVSGCMGIAEDTGSGRCAKDGGRVPGAGELTLLLSGGWTLFAHFAELAPDSPLGFWRESARFEWRVTSLRFRLFHRLSHLVYVDITAASCRTGCRVVWLGRI